MGIRFILNRITIIVFMLSAITVNIGHTDSLSGVVTRYTDDCPLQEVATISVRTKDISESVEEALSYQEKVIEKINSLMGTKSENFVVKEASNNISPRENLWSVSVVVVIDSSDVHAAKELFLKLASNGLAASLATTSIKPDRCRKK